MESGRGKCDADSPCSTTLSAGKNSAFCCDIEWSGAGVKQIVGTIDDCGTIRLLYAGSFLLSDNKNWLKWIIVQNQNGEMTFRTENVPIEQYDYPLPENRE